MDGSSPLTRGKHQTDRVRIHSRGLIPAHAGKTAFSGPPRWGFSAHPRSRGENPHLVSVVRMDEGSSPLTRGKRKNGVSAPGLDGLIPAHAGKTLHHPGCTKMRPAHPRSRGENAPLPHFPWLVKGSSPLTRGKHVALVVHELADRLIPAHAGKTLGWHQDLDQQRAHPRSRGENGPDAPLGILRAGSSPLTRGKQAPTMIGRGPPRLIPAHAGKTKH